MLSIADLPVNSGHQRFGKDFRAHANRGRRRLPAGGARGGRRQGDVTRTGAGRGRWRIDPLVLGAILVVRSWMTTRSRVGAIAGPRPADEGPSARDPRGCLETGPPSPDRLAAR